MDSDRITEEDRITSELVGNTLIVYLYLLRKGRKSSGPREVQKALGFSSPSSASYQLEKLRKLGLIDKVQSGDYQVMKVVKTSVISAFVFFGGRAFPKHLIYAIVTSVMILFFVSVFVRYISLMMGLALLPGILAAAIFWYETVKVWRQPSLRR